MPDPQTQRRSANWTSRPFPEQIAFFRGKLGNLVPTRRWDDISQEAHDSGFMVAGAQSADLLTDLVAAVDRAITEGTSLETFRGDFRAIVQRRGWHGWTGEGSRGGEAWRVRTIYRTNAATSYAAGRFAQLTAGNFAFWVYHHGDSRVPRLNHLSWDGLFLPPDHRWWTIYYPPSGWGCSCFVTGARSERAAIRQGGDPNKRLPDDWDRPDPNTGLPAGVQRGWGYAPGASVASRVQAIAGRVRHWDYVIAKGFMADIPDRLRDRFARSYRSLPSVADDAAGFARRTIADDKRIEPSRTLGLLTADDAAAIGRIAGGDVAGYDYSLSPSEIRHIQRAHGNAAVERQRGQRAVSAEDYRRLPEILNAPDAIVDGGVSEIGGGGHAVIFEKRLDGELYSAVFVVRRGRQTLALQTLYIR